MNTSWLRLFRPQPRKSFAVPLEHIAGIPTEPTHWFDRAKSLTESSCHSWDSPAHVFMLKAISLPIQQVVLRLILSVIFSFFVRFSAKIMCSPYLFRAQNTASGRGLPACPARRLGALFKFIKEKEGSVLQHTTNSQLSQWDASDRILRTDFNSDNSKLEAALTALRDACPYRIIRSVTTSSQASQIDLSVSGIDFSKYLKVELFFHSPEYTGTILVRVNNLSSSYAYGAISGGYSGSTQTSSYLAYMNNYSYGVMLFYTPTKVGNVGCVSISYDGAGTGTGLQFIAPCKWPNLQTFNFIGTNIPAGTTITICGVKA